MTKRHSLIAGLLISGALTVIAAQPAFAAPTDLYLELLSFNTSGVTGVDPLFAKNSATISTSNAGTVTTVPLPYEFVFSAAGSNSTPSAPLFVVEPQNNDNFPFNNNISSGPMQVTFNFELNNNPLQTYALTETVDFYAKASTDFDTLIWQQGSSGSTCSGSQTTYVAGTSCTYDFSIAGDNFSIEMDNETDWNMAEFDGASFMLASTKVPEPASIAMMGAGLLGFGMLWRRRRQKMSGAAI